MKETFVFSVKKDTRWVEVSNHWKYCVGSGQAKLAMRSDYARQLKLIHDELGIERVRFHGIFVDDMQAIMYIIWFVLKHMKINFGSNKLIKMEKYR